MSRLCSRTLVLYVKQWFLARSRRRRLLARSLLSVDHEGKSRKTYETELTFIIIPFRYDSSFAMTLWLEFNDSSQNFDSTGMSIDCLITIFTLHIVNQKWFAFVKDIIPGPSRIPAGFTGCKHAALSNICEVNDHALCLGLGILRRFNTVHACVIVWWRPETSEPSHICQWLSWPLNRRGFRKTIPINCSRQAENNPKPSHPTTWPLDIRINLWNNWIYPTLDSRWLRFIRVQNDHGVEPRNVWLWADGNSLDNLPYSIWIIIE